MTTTATSTSSSSWAARRPATRPTTRLFRNPGHGPPLAEGQAGRHQDQPCGARGQDPGRPEGRRRPDAIDPPDDRQQLQLRRQQPGRDDRPARRQRVATLTVSWPTSRTTQTFRDIPADQTIEIIEGSAGLQGSCSPPNDRWERMRVHDRNPEVTFARIVVSRLTTTALSLRGI